MSEHFKPGELASVKTLEARYGVVSKTLDKWIKSSGFPKPIMLNARKRVWPVAAILEWEKSRAMASGSESA
jgi:predicted DNA-binding transcriptional regulator AlpA